VPEQSREERYNKANLASLARQGPNIRPITMVVANLFDIGCVQIRNI
jgi:hypothetical protein